ncbi:hypothetical protein OG21DRAFT_1496951 [Imleria badia]|nr:hypothetical protein OG21DRAFT_1496951 [Imleria badia]
MATSSRASLALEVIYLVVNQSGGSASTSVQRRGDVVQPASPIWCSLPGNVYGSLCGPRGSLHCHISFSLLSSFQPSSLPSDSVPYTSKYERPKYIFQSFSRPLEHYSRLSPPQSRDHSARIVSEGEVIIPFYLLGFDQVAMSMDFKGVGFHKSAYCATNLADSRKLK